MKNITLSVDDKILAAARRYASDRDSSVNLTHSGTAAYDPKAHPETHENGAFFEILRVFRALEVKRTDNLKVSKDSKKLQVIFGAVGRFPVGTFIDGATCLVFVIPPWLWGSAVTIP